MKEYRNPVRCAGAAAALVLATALPAFAIRPIAVVSRAAIASVWDYDASDPELTKLPGKTPGEIGYGMDRVFDGSFADTNAVYMSAGKNGAAIVLEFPALPEIDHAEHTGVYVSEIVVGHVTGCDCSYSLYWSDTETNKTTTAIRWNPVPGAQRTTTSGAASYPLRTQVRYLKYVFDTTTGNDSLTEIQVKGYVSDMMHVVSSYDKTKWYRPDGSAMGSNGGGGNGNPARCFDGNFYNYQMFPRCPNNGYFILDLSADYPDGCYIQKILVSTTGAKRYTVSYSEDGSTWKTVFGPGTAAGILTNEVGAIATQIKYVFNDGSEGNWSDEYFAEFQVWGMDANDIPCTHPDIESVAWAPVAGSATCTAKGFDERFCPDCGERFAKVSDDPPLGHDYVSALARPGAFKRFGAGSIACSRCDYRIDFSNTPETDSTNGPIDLVTVGGLAMDNLVQFTDVTVTSTDHTDWGPNPFKIIDDSWVRWWVSYWVSAGLRDQHADFRFGTEIDLTQIQIVLHNLPQTILFFDVDDDTGEETQLRQFTILRTDVYTNAADLAAIGFPAQLLTQADDRGRRVPYRFYPGGENGEWAPTLDYGRFGTDCWDSLVVTNDLNIPANYTNPDGTHPTHVNDDGETVPDSNDNNQFQSFIVRFYEQPCRHLRIRNDTTQPTGFQLWSGKSMSIIECHPWGIVRGAGETRYRKETMIIFR